MKDTIIFPGSFDPVHNGHINLAVHVSQLEDVDEIWIMPSRRNPLKNHDVRASDAHRLAMLRVAATGIPDIKISDLELTLPYPSYTYRTLLELERLFPDRHFRLLIGSDNWKTFNKWWHAQEITKEFGLMIYPRPGYDAFIPPELKEKVMLLEKAPIFPYSSTQVRDILAEGKDAGNILDTHVYNYIISNRLYH